MGGYKKITKEESKATNFANMPENRNNNGQPPKIMSKIIRELKDFGYERVTASMVLEAYEYLLGLDSAMLMILSMDTEQPRILQIVSREMLSDKSSAEMLETMLDRAHGKAVQGTRQVDKDGNDITPLNIHLFSKEELLAHLDKNDLK